MGYPYYGQYGQYGQYSQYGQYLGMQYYNPYYMYSAAAAQQGGMSANAMPFVPASGLTPDASTTREYKGVLKKMSTRNGFGFILCEELMALYRRDVYVDNSLLPEGVEAGTPLRFTFSLSDKHHPRAETVFLDTPASSS